MTMDIHGHPSALKPPEIRAIPVKTDNKAKKGDKGDPGETGAPGRTEKTV